jgi:hypothetical protein
VFNKLNGIIFRKYQGFHNLPQILEQRVLLCGKGLIEDSNITKIFDLYRGGRQNNLFITEGKFVHKYCKILLKYLKVMI